MCIRDSFYNYKHQHIIVLLAIVDENYRFITVDVGSYGRNSDGGVFKSSAIGKMLYASKLNFPPKKAFPKQRLYYPLQCGGCGLVIEK